MCISLKNVANLLPLVQPCDIILHLFVGNTAFSTRLQTQKHHRHHFTNRNQLTWDYECENFREEVGKSWRYKDRATALRVFSVRVISIMEVGGRRRQEMELKQQISPPQMFKQPADPPCRLPPGCGDKSRPV